MAGRESFRAADERVLRQLDAMELNQGAQRYLLIRLDMLRVGGSAALGVWGLTGKCCVQRDSCVANRTAKRSDIAALDPSGMLESLLVSPRIGECVARRRPATCACAGFRPEGSDLVLPEGRARALVTLGDDDEKKSWLPPRSGAAAGPADEPLSDFGRDLQVRRGVARLRRRVL
jgi:hypothetical protein